MQQPVDEGGEAVGGRAHRARVAAVRRRGEGAAGARAPRPLPARRRRPGATVATLIFYFVSFEKRTIIKKLIP